MEVAIIGVPADLGVDRRGVDLGPSAIRFASLGPSLEAAGCKVQDLGDLPVPQRDSQTPEDHELANFAAVLDTNRRLAREVEGVMGRGQVPLVLGGDHSLAIGSVAGSSRHAGALGLLFFDAHGDFNVPETSPSGNIHGMCLAVSVGDGNPELVGCGGKPATVNPERVVLLGCRDLDPEEKGRLRESPLSVFSMREIDRRGMDAVMEEALEIVSAGTCGYHVSFDLDVLDPLEAPGVGTAVPGGISFRESQLALDKARERGGLLALDLVEVNPISDTGNRTAELAVRLAISALGDRGLRPYPEKPGTQPGRR